MYEDKMCAAAPEVRTSDKLNGRIVDLASYLNMLDELSMEKLQRFLDARPRPVEAPTDKYPHSRELLGNSEYYMQIEEILTRCESLIKGISNRFKEAEL